MTPTRTLHRNRQHQILRALSKSGIPASRELLADLTGLHQNKINGRVRELLDSGYLIEKGTTTTTSGCKAKLLHLSIIGRAMVKVAL